MANGEMYIVAKPRFETNAEGQSAINVVDVWLVPDNGQGQFPSLIDDRRAGVPQMQAQCGCGDQRTYQDPQRFYQDDRIYSDPRFYLNQQRYQTQFASPYQHLTLIRTQQGWQLLADADPRLSQYDAYRNGQQQRLIDPRYQQYRSVDPRLQLQVRPQYDPRYAVDPRQQYDPQRQYQLEMQRQYQLEMQRRYLEAQRQQEIQRYQSGQPQQRGTGSRARFGVDPSNGAVIDQRYQQLRREAELGYSTSPGGYVPQGRARYGVDPRTSSIIGQRDQAIRQQTQSLDDEIYEYQQRQREYQQQQQRGYAPQTQMPNDGTRWAPKARNLRSWDDNLDFDPDGTKVPASVGNYLKRYGPPQRPGQPGNPNGQYVPITPGSIVTSGIESSLSSFGDWLRGK